MMDTEKNEKNYIFLGLMYDKKYERDYIANSKTGLQNAVNSFQWSLIDGLIDLDCHLQITYVVPVGQYPLQYRQWYLPSRRWYYRNRYCVECGSLNLCFFKQIQRERVLYDTVMNWIKNTEGEKNILVYSMYLPFLRVLRRIQKKYPEVFTTIIVTDLPGNYGILPKNPLKAAVLCACGKKMLSLSKYCNSFVLMTEAMKIPLSVGSKPYAVIEGICPLTIDCIPEVQHTEKKVIFYSGTLHYQFGIKTLLYAFSLIHDPDTELWICGSGEAADEIIKKAKKDSRIRFWGYCTQNKVMQLRSHATVLVNPRTNEGEYTKYSFPSKTMEYLASGIPVVMYRLNGVSEEYYSYLITVSESGGVGMSRVLEEVLSWDPQKRDDFGKTAQQFVLSQKNRVVQAKKILKIIERPCSRISYQQKVEQYENNADKYGLSGR